MRNKKICLNILHPDYLDVKIIKNQETRLELTIRRVGNKYIIKPYYYSYQEITLYKPVFGKLGGALNMNLRS
jgi:hypothetical protein